MKKKTTEKKTFYIKKGEPLEITHGKGIKIVEAYEKIVFKCSICDKICEYKGSHEEIDKVLAERKKAEKIYGKPICEECEEI